MKSKVRALIAMHGRYVKYQNGIIQQFRKPDPEIRHLPGRITNILWYQAAIRKKSLLTPIFNIPYFLDKGFI